MVFYIYRKLFILIFTTNLLLGLEFTSQIPRNQIKLVQESSANQWCPVTGLNLADSYKTSFVAKFIINGNIRQYCCITALAMDLQEFKLDMDSIEVVDFKTNNFINANKAYYVIESTFTDPIVYESSFGFENQNDALEFISRYEGKIVAFETLLQQTIKNLDKMNETYLTKKQKKIYPRGKKIFNKMCDANTIDPNDYIQINELKSEIVSKKLCTKLKENDLQAVALYLWEVKRYGESEVSNDKVKVEEHEKCPVCGMFTYKYPRWAAQIFYKHTDHQHHFSFDGVKDLMKFYFDPMRWGDYKTSTQNNIAKILVTDYYSQKGIDGKQAFYVIRSDVYGPMGHELIPFKNESDAKQFLKDHFGKQILRFDQITEKLAYDLDFNE